MSFGENNSVEPFTIQMVEPLWVVHPGTLRYPISEKITALPLRGIHQIERKNSPRIFGIDSVFSR